MCGDWGLFKEVMSFHNDKKKIQNTYILPINYLPQSDHIIKYFII